MNEFSIRCLINRGTSFEVIYINSRTIPYLLTLLRPTTICFVTIYWNNARSCHKDHADFSSFAELYKQFYNFTKVKYQFDVLVLLSYFIYALLQIKKTFGKIYFLNCLVTQFVVYFTFLK